MNSSAIPLELKRPAFFKIGETNPNKSNIFTIHGAPVTHGCPSAMLTMDEQLLRNKELCKTVMLGDWRQWIFCT